MAKKRIVVMYGGKADEHSISCILSLIHISEPTRH